MISLLGLFALILGLLGLSLGDVLPKRPRPSRGNRSDEIIVKRSYREGQLEREELRYVGQKAIDKYVDGMSKSLRPETISNVELTRVVELIRQDKYDQAEVEAQAGH